MAPEESPLSPDGIVSLWFEASTSRMRLQKSPLTQFPLFPELNYPVYPRISDSSYSSSNSIREHRQEHDCELKHDAPARVSIQA